MCKTYCKVCVVEHCSLVKKFPKLTMNSKHKPRRSPRSIRVVRSWLCNNGKRMSHVGVPSMKSNMGGLIVWHASWQKPTTTSFLCERSRHDIATEQNTSANSRMLQPGTDRNNTIAMHNQSSMLQDQNTVCTMSTHVMISS